MNEVITASPQSTDTPSFLENEVPNGPRGVTMRVIVLSLVLAAVLGYLMPVIDFKLYNTFLGATHLPPGAIGVLMVLLLVVNPLLKLISKKWAFTREESLTVYITCLFSSLVPGHGTENLIIPALLSPFYYATRSNGWLEWLTPYIQPWMTPALNSDKSINTNVVQPWFQGSQGAKIPWEAWLVPLGIWMGVVLVSYYMMACMSVILRRQWAQNEALAFPLLRLPLQMVDTPAPGNRAIESVSFWKDRLMWTGFGLVFLMQTIRGLHVYYPDVPDIQLGLDFNPYLSEAPWNQIDGISCDIFPIAIGITYLLSSEVALSLWLGYFFIKFQHIIAYYAGYMPNGLPGSGFGYGKAFTFYQVQGGYWMYVILLLWMSREHLGHIFKRAIGRLPADADEREEMMTYPMAFWGFLVCFSILLAFACAAGVRLDIALALWTSYIVFTIALTRVAAEGGLLFLLHDSQPLGTLARLLPNGGNDWLNYQSGLVPAAFIQGGFIAHMRGFIAPSFLHAFKLAHDQKIAPKRLGWLLAGVISIAIVVSWTTCVRLGYENEGLSLANQGWVQALAQRSVQFVTTMIAEPKTSTSFNVFWFSFGSGLTYLMMLARARLSWFPFHPAGYLMSLTWPAQALWCSIFLGWMIKTLVLRFGGPDTYRKATPFFLGVAFGDVASIIMWLMVDGIDGRKLHLLMPN